MFRVEEELKKKNAIMIKRNYHFRLKRLGTQTEAERISQT